MIKKDKVIVFDIDGTICEIRKSDQSYSDVKPIDAIVEKIRKLKKDGYWIILNTARQMRTYEGNVGEIVKNQAKILIDWLDQNDIPYDELHFGKPWCGSDGYYVDDKSIRPSEFASLSESQIKKLLDEEEKFNNV